jgi:glycyl-tRNA synthetase beta chain
VNDFVLEIGAENIPASYIRPAFQQLADDAESLFGELRLPWDEIYATGTPRRLVLIVDGLAERQEAAEITVTGPPASKAWDEDGAPTKAAEGFARSQGVPVETLTTFPTEKGDYLGVRRQLECRPALDLLSEHLPGLIAALRFPKVMKWEQSGTRFARPVRWIVCLYGTRVVKFRFADVDSGRTSFGRPWLRGERIPVGSAASYLKDLGKKHIIVDDDTRRQRIGSMAASAAEKAGLVPVEDPGLVDELSFMVEDPHLLMGEFPPGYLDLPPEVVTTAMRSHQRYIALRDRAGSLVPRFITFTDGRVLGPAQVRRGNEKVLNARLADAQFYWQEDLKRGVDGLADELNRIVFVEGLGTIGQKSARIGKIARYVNDRLEPQHRQEPSLVVRAAALAKADLASEMIKDGKEFTLLQGLIGSHYAREGGEPDAVADAIDQHYRPRTPGDALPDSGAATAVGIADRVDTICGCFLVGLKPTGSQDPYGLRRLANGLFRIVERQADVRLDELVRFSLDLYVQEGLADQGGAGAAAGEVDDFFRARCGFFLKEHGIAYDVVDAVSRVSWAQPGAALATAREIARLRGDTLFERLITGVKRVGNILAEDQRWYGTDWTTIKNAFKPETERENVPEPLLYSARMFSEAPEHKLLKAVSESIPAMAELDRRGDLGGVLTALSGLADPIDFYFDEVLVNCEDPGIRRNRHRFLAAVFCVFGKYADFSYIVDRDDS